ncbi:MAG: hypothetical protein D6794_08750 [Deltaproteobacteria bacterium]|nr:MAG: hypothetical protein D6794_08750 [Deltaproteobacteria bacterium]
MPGLVQEIMTPPDRVDTDLLVAFFQPEAVAPDGPAGLIDLRLDGVLVRHLGDGGMAGQSLLIRPRRRLACRWVLLLADVGERDPDDRIEKALQTARESGFRSLVLAPPMERNVKPAAWLEALQRLAGQGGYEDMECLITFNSTYMHEHNAVILNT